MNRVDIDIHHDRLAASTLGHDFLDIMDLVIHTLFNRTGKAWMPVTLFKHRREHFSHAGAVIKERDAANTDGLVAFIFQTFYPCCVIKGKCIFRAFTTKSDIFWEKQHGLINGIINRFWHKT